MTTLAAERIEDLKGRGYANAGLYDPQGVGGTHVMYVLQHADKPSLYNDLPDDPSISGVVANWKGATKPVGLAAVAVSAVGPLNFVAFVVPQIALRLTDGGQDFARRRIGLFQLGEHVGRRRQLGPAVRDPGRRHG